MGPCRQVGVGPGPVGLHGVSLRHTRSGNPGLAGVELAAGSHTLTASSLIEAIGYDVVVITNEPSLVPEDGRLTWQHWPPSSRSRAMTSLTFVLLAAVAGILAAHAGVAAGLPKRTAIEFIDTRAVEGTHFLERRVTPAKKHSGNPIIAD